MTKTQRIQGFPVFRSGGRDFTTDEHGGKKAINGPHQDAAWARDILGTNQPAAVRRAQSIERARLNGIIITLQS